PSEHSHMMIHTLSIELVGGPINCKPLLWVVEIPGDWNIEDLRDLLFDMVNLDPEHASGFYLANQPWGSVKIWLDDDDEDYDFLISAAPLPPGCSEPEDPDEPEAADEPEDTDEQPLQTFDQLYPLPKHKKLYFLYDFGACWRFEIRRKGRSRPAKEGVEYPQVLTNGGHLPEFQDGW
ncbi:MAG TPA: hypothetical protein PKE44_17140, partial [Plasticicumulans sp.]|uniref:IS1096 element passenger TnpR family protein n=2 Tax=Plasticicumulans sp. TaxID=2307179 RepID=UPI002CBFF0CE